jgi:hypothetical protein
MHRDPSLDALLALDGVTIVIDDQAGYWVKFVVREVPVTASRPHGLDYSLTLHGPDNERLVGFDNAHSVRIGRGPGAERSKARDHRHRLKSVSPYEYRDAATLLADFWAQVDALLREKGILE